VAGDRQVGGSRYASWLLLAGILGYQWFVHLHTRFADWPETIFFSWIVSRGLLPYRDFFEVHNPGLYYLNGLLFHLFGFHIHYLRWEVALVMGFNAALLFLLVKRRLGSLPGVTAVFLFTLLEFQFFGNGIWFEQFVLPCLLIAGYVLCEAQPENNNRAAVAPRYIVAGFVLGLGALIKQPVLWNFLGLLGLLLVWNIVRRAQPLSKLVSQILVFAMGFAIPLLLNFFYLMSQGAGEQYLYGALYKPILDWSFYRSPKVSHQIQLLFWGLLSVLFLYSWSKEKREYGNFEAWVLVVLFFTSLLFDFPYHGKVHLVPAVAFLSIFVTCLFFHIRRRTLWLLLFLIPFLIWTTVGHVRFLKNAWGEKYKILEETSRQAALWVKRNTDRNERIYVLQKGGMQFYPLSDRLPASYNAYQFLPSRRSVESVVGDLEKNRPRLILVGNNDTDSRQFPGSRVILLGYVHQHYEPKIMLEGGIQVYEIKSPEQQRVLKGEVTR
jgi:hypothetical protein